jgi:hypothetical protein
MERSFIRERHQIITATYHDLSINDAFMDEINDVEWVNSYKTNVGAKMSDWTMKSDNITKIYEWVEYLLHDTFPDMPVDHYELYEAWYAKYDEGDRTKIHDHKFVPWSFVYFIKSPPESSSLYFPTSNKEITPDEGRIVVFPGNVEHYVPENKSNGRVVLAGNLK